MSAAAAGLVLSGCPFKEVGMTMMFPGLGSSVVIAESWKIAFVVAVKNLP